MNLVESTRIAWRSLKGYKLRSTLATLGVIIGIAAVIAFVSLGLGLEAGILGDLLGDDQQNVYVWATTDQASEQRPLAGAQPVFTRADAAAIAAQPGVERAYVFTRIPGESVAVGGQEIPRQGGLFATEPAYFEGEDFAEGGPFGPASGEAVINPAFAALFATNVTAGDTVRVTVFGGTSRNVTVAGVLGDSEPISAFEGFYSVPRLYLSAEAVEQYGVGGRMRYVAVIAEASSGRSGDVERARSAIRASLADSDVRERVGENARFEVGTTRDLLGSVQGIVTQLQNFVVGIAAISLLVGSIGIANVMLVSVTERTREIGLLKALGAQRRDIVGLFLIEAVTLSVAGAVLGVPLGLAGGYVLAVATGVPYVVPTVWIAVAVGIGLLVGVVAGLYPAWRAARVSPIQALRRE